MTLLLQSALAWKELCKCRYEITYGRKGRQTLISLCFEPGNYRHLAGFQYLRDLVLPNFTASQFVNKVISGAITQGVICKGEQYEEMVAPRLRAIVSLKECLDSGLKLYGFDVRRVPGYSKIKADYLLSFGTPDVSFAFLVKVKNADAGYGEVCNCCSMFEMGGKDYTTNQTRMAILRVRRIDLETGRSEVLFDRITDAV